MSICYLGIDQSLSGTGLCLLDEGGNILHTGIITPKKLRGVFRLRFIVDELVKFILDKCSEFDEIRASREGYSFSSKGAALFDLGELGGVIDLAIYDLANDQLKSKAIQYYKIPAGVHKKLVIKNGNAKKGTTKAQKQQYLDLITKHTGEVFLDDNIADSYMIATTLRTYYMIMSDELFYANLVMQNRENGLLFIPPKLRKRKNLTPSRIYSMCYKRFTELAEEVFRDTYLIFNNVVYND